MADWKDKLTPTPTAAATAMTVGTVVVAVPRNLNRRQLLVSPQAGGTIVVGYATSSLASLGTPVGGAGWLEDIYMGPLYMVCAGGSDVAVRVAEVG